MPHIRSTFVFYSPFYLDSPFHIPPYNQLRTQPSHHIYPVPAAAKLHPTPEEPIPALQQCEHAQTVCAQPPPTLAAPPTHANPTAARPGRTTKDQPEVLEDNRGGSEEEKQQRSGTEEHTTAGTQQQREQHGSNTSTQPPLSPFKRDVHTTTNDHDTYVMLSGYHGEPCSGVITPIPKHDTIGQLTHELVN